MKGRTGTVMADACPPGSVCADPASGSSPAPMQGAHLRDIAWPLQSSLELGAFPTAVPCARLHARCVLMEWGLASLAEVVELVVSELVTNAVQATAVLADYPEGQRLDTGVPPVRLQLRSDGHICVIVQIWDGNHQLPVRRDTGPEAEGGRGLLLVESLSAEWGSYRPAGSSGKVVWAVVGTPSQKAQKA